MSDFGKIYEQWEQMQRAERTDPERATIERPSFERALDRYPIVDKDGQGEAPGDDRRHAPSPDRLPIEDRIDLHGLTVEEALAATRSFLNDCAGRGLRKVLVIHGKGRNGEGVLRREVRAYLERDPRTGAMGYAGGPEGGRGALWVVLRDRTT
ncbi:MAG: Smr/MutS family protein [Spirochaetales bacterium]